MSRGTCCVGCPLAQLVACCHCAHASHVSESGWERTYAASAGAVCRMICCSNPQLQQMRKSDALMAKENKTGWLSTEKERLICDLSLRSYLVSSLPSLRWSIPHTDAVPRILSTHRVLQALRAVRLAAGRRGCITVCRQAHQHHRHPHCRTSSDRWQGR